MTDYTEIVAEFRRIRIEKNINAKEISESASNVYNFESGRKKLRLDTFLRWLQAMGMQIEIKPIEPK